MATTAELIQQYIALTNTPGSPSFPIFAETLEWREVHSGRTGGQTELFAAMRESREMFDSMKLEVKSLIIEGESAALEADWSGRIIANGANITVPMVYLFGVRGGKIIREIDYVVMPSAG